MSIRVTVWGENVHERKNRVVAQIYPDTMHGTIAAALNREDGITATTVTLQDADHGLTPAKLAETDVLVWWGHAAHGEVRDDIVDRVCDAVWGGMGMIFLHSAHFAKPFKRLMGAPCNLTWREAGERERLWVTSRQHPIARGLPDHFELEHEEMYGEPFGVPEPLETVFISWFAGARSSAPASPTGAGRATSSTSARGTKPIPPTTMPMSSASSPMPCAGPTTPRRGSRTPTPHRTPP